MANHGSITGSIGVIAMTANLKELFKKLGISMTIIKSGKYKDVLSSHRDLLPEEREFLQEMIDTSYQKFLKDIALGRNMNISEIEPYADGRVFTGKTAMEYGLIDKVGTFDDALSRARELGNLPEDSPVYESQKRPWQKILTSLDGMVRNWIYDLRHGSGIKLEYR
jgi:protease-4